MSTEQTPPTEPTTNDPTKAETPAPAATAAEPTKSSPAEPAAALPRKRSPVLKWGLRLGVAAVLLVVAGLVVLYFVMDGIIRTQVQQQSAKSLNLGTQLDKATFKPFAGHLNLTGYRVDNPAGFAKQPIIDLGGLDVKVNYAQLTKNPVRIEEIAITRPRMLLEHKDGKFNIKALAENLPGQPPPPTAPPPGQPAPQPAPQPQPPSQPPPQQPAPPPAEPADQKKLIIGKIVVADAVVVLRPGVPNLLKEEIEIPIQTFTMAGIGNADGNNTGAAMKDVVMQLATTLAAKANATDLARQFLPAELASILDGDLTGVTAKYIPGEAGQVVTALLKDANVLKKPADAVRKNAAGLVDQELNKVAPGVTDQFGGLSNLLDDKKKKEEEKKKKEEREREKKREGAK